MNKSAMQELIEWIQVYCDHQPYLLPEEAINKATELLQKERQQIIDAYHINPKESIYVNNGADYYNKTYKQ